MGLEREKSTPRGAGAPEIEITPEMIEAGVKELLRYDSTCPENPSWEETVMMIYRAMATTSR